MRADYRSLLKDLQFKPSKWSAEALANPEFQGRMDDEFDVLTRELQFEQKAKAMVCYFILFYFTCYHKRELQFEHKAKAMKIG